MRLDPKSIELIKSDPNHLKTYLREILNRIDKDDFLKIYECFNTSSLSRELLRHRDLIDYCADISFIPKNKLFKDEENFLAYIINLALEDMTYLSLHPDIMENILRLHWKYPQLVCTAIDHVLQAKNKFSQSYLRMGNIYVPYLPHGKSNTSSVRQIIDDFQQRVAKHKIYQLDLINKYFRYSFDPLDESRPYFLSTEEKDALSILTFLNDAEKVTAQLKKLEAKLELKAGQKSTHKKLLTDYLKEWAKKNGLQGWTKIPRALTDWQFHHVLRQRTLFKDVSNRTSEHGEFTHVLQLYCLIEYNNEAKNSGEVFLINDPPDLMRWMGEVDTELNRLEGDDHLLKSIWYHLFDGSSKEIGSNFNCPEKFNSFLMSQESKGSFPLLHQLLLERTLKTKIKNNQKVSGTEPFVTQFFEPKKFKP